MGLFKDLRGLKKQADDLQAAAGTKRPSLREGLRQASEMMGDVQAQLEAQQHLTTEGTAATAVVDAVRPTQQFVNQMPVVECDLRVQLPEGREAPVSHRQAIPHVYLAQLVPGAEVAVLVDAADPQRLTLTFG